MMGLERAPVRIACAILAAVLSCGAAASAQSVALTVDSEAGFRRFITMAQDGRLGEEVTNANVGVAHDHVRIELVRTDGKNQFFELTYPQTERFRYFDIAPGEGATEADVSRVGQLLDEAFDGDPFQLSGVEESRAGGAVPSLTTAWSKDGAKGVLRALERRMMSLMSLRYTVGVIVGLAIGFCACLAMLWGSGPPLDPRRH